MNEVEAKKKAEARAKMLQELEDRRKRLSEHINEVLKTEAGKKVFRYIHDYCSFDRTSIVLNPLSRQVDKTYSLYNMALRDVYLELRSLADRKLLVAVEFPDVGEIKEENNGK